MNIYALKGHKVRCSTFSAGYDHHKEVAKKHLEIGQEYTIERTSVDRFHTDVWLQELPNVAFNSVFFEDVTPQDKELNKQHHNWNRYNRA